MLNPDKFNYPQKLKKLLRMKSIFFTVNWKAINKVLEGDNAEERQALHTELSDIKKKFEKKSNEEYCNRRKRQELQRVANIKKLPNGAELFYTGYSIELFGKSGTKVRDGRLYIVIAFGDSQNPKLWKIPYKNVSDQPPTDSQKTTFKVQQMLSN